MTRTCVLLTSIILFTTTACGSSGGGDIDLIPSRVDAVFASMTLYSGGVEAAAVYNIQLDGVVSTDPLTVKSGAPSTVRFQILPTPILDAFVAPVNPDVAKAKTLLVRLLCEMCASDSLQEQWVEYDAPKRTSTEATFAVTPTVEASLLSGGRGRLLFTVLND